MKLGAFSVRLAVKDLGVSKDLYKSWDLRFLLEVWNKIISF